MNIGRRFNLKSNILMINAVWFPLLVGFIGITQQNCWAKEDIKVKQNNLLESTIQITDNMIPFHEVDFGRIQQNNKLKHVLNIINKTNKPIKIKGVTTSCSCTAAILSEKQIPAHESTQIQILFDTKGMYGDAYKPALIHFENIELKPIQVDLLAFVYVPSARFTISSLYFDSIPVGKGAIRKFHIVNKDDPGLDWKIVKVETSSSLITARYIPNRGEIVCELSEETPKGPLNEKIIILTKDKNSLLPIEIPVLGEIKDDIKITPERFYLGTLKKREFVKKVLRIANIDNGRPVVFKKNNYFIPKLDHQDGKVSIYNVDFCTPNEPGFFSGTITLEIGHSQIIRIPYAGFVLD